METSAREGAQGMEAGSRVLDMPPRLEEKPRRRQAAELCSQGPHSTDHYQDCRMSLAMRAQALDSAVRQERVNRLLHFLTHTSQTSAVESSSCAVYCNDLRCWSHMWMGTQTPPTLGSSECSPLPISDLGRAVLPLRVPASDPRTPWPRA